MRYREASRRAVGRHVEAVRAAPGASPAMALSHSPCHGRAGQVVKLQPRALWIIGNNGRVDLKCDGGRYLIVDAAENFEEPDWQAARAERRCDRESVSREWLRRLLQ